MATTKRPQNKCKSCSYTWYPRGKSLSNKCPNCGSKEVAIKWSWGGIAALAIAGGLLFNGADDKPIEAKPSAQALPNVTQPQEVIESPAQDFGLKGSTQTVANEFNDLDNSKTQTHTRIEKINEKISLENEVPLTPTSICARESNIFSRNNCEWRECEKIEFSGLAECTHKKSKEEIFGG